MKIQTTSRPNHVWPDALTRIWESSSKKKETRRSEWRNCYSMQKTVFPNMHTGNRCSKITRAEVSEAKFICIDIAGEGRISVLYYNFGTRIRSNEKI